MVLLMDIDRLSLWPAPLRVRTALPTQQIVGHLSTLFKSEAQLMTEASTIDPASQLPAFGDSAPACCTICGTPFRLEPFFEDTSSINYRFGVRQGHRREATCPNAIHAWHSRAKDIKQSIDLWPDSQVAALLHNELQQLLSAHLTAT